MIDKISVRDCTLCGSCRNACPVDAIQFSKAYLDFHYPEIDADRCAHCGQCEKACPLLGSKGKPGAGYPVAFAARSTDDSIRLHSSSGGVFYALASQMLQDGGFVCGAVFDERFHVRHIVSDKQENLFRMMGSKYAQSDMGHCYREIKEKLRAGKRVLFSGCPCQVAGLRTYLGKNDTNLFLVELICHGIPSDQMLHAYISMREKKYGARLKRLEFRNKAKGWHNSSVRMEFENQRIYSESIAADAYMNGFLGNVTLKSSCYDCRFRSFAAGSDIILGDFWGAEAELPEDDNKGISAVIVNTGKGMDILNHCNLTLISTNVETIIKYNKNLIQSAEPSPRRGLFYAYAENAGIEEAIQKHLEESLSQKAKRQGRYMLRSIWYTVRGKGKPLY